MMMLFFCSICKWGFLLNVLYVYDSHTFFVLFVLVVLGVNEQGME